MQVGDEGSGNGWAVATVAVAAILLLVVTGGLVAIYHGLQGVEVGPDAEEMAQDPVLHVELPRATADDIVARTGTEGGVMPAMANRTSEARRAWTSETADWESLLVTALTAVDAHGVTWSALQCQGDMVFVHGRKDIEVHGESLAAGVSIYLSEIGAADRPLRLSIELSSQGDPAGTRVPASGAPAVEGECPDRLRTTFERLRDQP